MKILKKIIISMRPEQWTKNIIVFAGLFFAKKLSDPATLFSTIEIFCIFCIVSSASYILNDIIDRKEDMHHPDKCKRPIAKGELNIGPAAGVSFALVSTGLFWAWMLSGKLFAIVVIFLVLHIAYDLALKHISIIDVFAISLAFILRLLAGVSVSGITSLISSWILLCTFLLALFLALCKRRAEMALLLERSKQHRKSLEGYSLEFLDQLITIVAGCSILSYALYALSAETVAKHGTDKLKYTIPFVAYGIFRYLYLVNMRRGGSNPEKILLKDIPFLVNILCYCAIVYLLVYRGIF
ncbi:MAG: decaprenyl-phosphate phosphoribosyltransferase [Candidatus Omnitrophica bacterium]|nr:decaprenyl-phosphate phosphoribosyltransferase [Candidatus Omnitrophota bacterium]